jgi:hypothetical protein
MLSFGLSMAEYRFREGRITERSLGPLPGNAGGEAFLKT